MKFYSNIGSEGFVEVRYASGRTEEWELNDELDVERVPQDPPPEEVYASGKAEQREFDEDLDIATVPQDPLPEEVSLTQSRNRRMSWPSSTHSTTTT